MQLLLLSAYLIVTIIRFGLDWINIRHRQKGRQPLPDAFAGQIDEERLDHSDAYALAGDRVGFVEDLLGVVLTLAFLFGGNPPLVRSLDRRLYGQFHCQWIIVFWPSGSGSAADRSPFFSLQEFCPGRTLWL